MAVVSFCPHCRGTEIYHEEVVAHQGNMDLLPGIGSFLSFGRFDVYACAGCGHVQLFIQSDRLDQLRENWDKVETRLERHE